MTSLDLSKIKVDIRSRTQIVRPDPTFYMQIKKISLVDLPVSDIKPGKIPLPKSLKIKDKYLEEAWFRHHGALIEMTYQGKLSKTPLRSIFPGPYIPWLEGRIDIIGDTAYSIFIKTLKTIKQRIPDLSKLKKSTKGYLYQNSYYPIVKEITQPEEGWFLEKISCPVVEGVYFPLPNGYGFSKKDKDNLEQTLKLIRNKCDQFCCTCVGSKNKRSRKKIREILSLIRSLEYLFPIKIDDEEIEAADEILSYFSRINRDPANAAKFLFELDHAVSYLKKLQKKEIVLSGVYGMSWLDVFKLPLEDLIETELGDISRVLREVKSFFSVGWAPILVHLFEESGFNTDGTHRHYALLTVELLRRLKKKFKKPLRKIDLRSDLAAKIILDFRDRYKKDGLSLRETVRTVSYLINSDNAWPYLKYLEINLDKIENLEFKWVPAVYLPEWRARVVVKNLCDKGIALVGVPPLNIEIVGKSNGKKGIFIRGGYHGDDRQPNFWFDMISFQDLK